MIVVLLCISADSRLWQRDAQPEQITVFCDFIQETSEMIIKCGFICDRYNVSLFLEDLSTLTSVLNHTEYQRASLTISPSQNYNLPFMGHKILYLSSLLVTCHLSSRLYGVINLTHFEHALHVHTEFFLDKN